MQKGFYSILLAQFFSSLADNALFLSTIMLLTSQGAPSWYQASVVPIFALFYVILAPFLGAFADSQPKGKVMLICNGIKLVGCLLMLIGLQPLLAYMLVGLGAAAYSPAKYGIMTEVLPTNQLVKGNGWMEVSTVLSIILGTILGGVLPKLITATIVTLALQTTIEPIKISIALIILIYLIAAFINLSIPRTDVKLIPITGKFKELVNEFFRANAMLWNDKLGQISLAATTIFWGVSGNMRYLLIPWAYAALNYNESQTSLLLGMVAFGTTLGALVASCLVRLEKTTKILFFGVFLGGCLLLLNVITDAGWAYAMVALTGAVAGFLLVPMNALLQHRGYVLLNSGTSIAVQNYNEQACILILGLLLMLSTYLGYSVYVSITWLGVSVMLLMLGLMLWNRLNFIKNPQRMQRLLRRASKHS